MKVTPLSIRDVLLIAPRTFKDDRGYFFETWREDRYAAAGISGPFVQDNVSFSTRGVLRGLHFQYPGQAQGKLVSVLQGAVWDVAVDVRADSATLGEWVGKELSDENHHQLWVPPGFAHGFVVLSDVAIFSYKCTAAYSQENEVTVRWNDPRFAIRWPTNTPILSLRDAAAGTFDTLPADRIPRMTPG